MRRVVIGGLGAIVMACARGEKREASPPSVVAAPIVSYAQLGDAFLSGHPPRNADLTGVWAEVRSIQTLAFLEGRSGPDRVRFDSTGLKVDDETGKPLSWTLTFAKIGPASYVVTHHMGGHVTDPENATLDTAGRFSLSPDIGSDQGVTFACRLIRAGRVVCLEGDGDGLEFAQFSTVAPPRPPPFCPLTCVSECAGSCNITPFTILADAKVCYHLLYSVTHRPGGGPATDTWIVLGADSLPPIGKWQYAAVFDDSVVRVAGWRRTAHTPPLPAGAHPERAPLPDALELRLTQAGTNIRGEFGYGSDGISGTLFLEEKPDSWGISGERRPCPAPRELRP